jgi:hypothetical protein
MVLRTPIFPYLQGVQKQVVFRVTRPKLEAYGELEIIRIFPEREANQANQFLSELRRRPPTEKQSTTEYYSQRWTLPSEGVDIIQLALALNKKFKW